MKMRAFQKVLLVLLNTWYLVNARLPYIKSSGYYSPFPPTAADNRVIYEFSSANSDTASSAKSRETRDLAWREFDAFLNGNEEPSCADLRRMWRLARKLQQEEQAIESNEIPREMHPFKAASYSTVEDKSSQEEPIQLSQSNKAEGSSGGAQHKKFSDEAKADEEEEVFGIVKTHAPPQAPQVRDPTKEILSGLYGPSSHHSQKQHFQPYFGRIRTHQQVPPVKESSFQILKNTLYGKSPAASDNNVDTYGKVHRFNPQSQQEPPQSNLDLVRSLLTKEEGLQVNVESKNAFDRIRDQLLNTRDHVRSKQRNFRRKGSKKRRRNAEEIAVIKERLFNDYMKTLPRYQSSQQSDEAEEEKKRRRRRQKNRKNQYKKWKISQNKIREQNLLLKKLGK